MQVSPEELQALFRSMSDDELIDHMQERPLTAAAMAVLRTELENRSINPPAALPAAVEPSETGETPVFDLNSRLLILARYLNVVEARIHCALLQSEGIAATLADEHTAVTDNYVFYALGGVRLMVPAWQLDAAQQLIAEVRNGQRSIGDEYYDGLPMEKHEAMAPSREQFVLTSVLLLAGVGLLATFLMLG